MVHFRPNVALLLLRSDGKLLICERWKMPGAWQFPQGGVDSGESPEQALYREVQEEIGLKKKHYSVIRSQGGYRYLYPKGIREKKLRKHGSHGQEQSYFLCKLISGEETIDVVQKNREFETYSWILPSEFRLAWLPKFKWEVYRAVMSDFFNVTLSDPGEGEADILDSSKYR